MASNDLRGQIEYAHGTSGWIPRGVFEIVFFNISSGFCVKREVTHGQTDTFPLYIFRFAVIIWKNLLWSLKKMLKIFAGFWQFDEQRRKHHNKSEFFMKECSQNPRNNSYLTFSFNLFSAFLQEIAINQLFAVFPLKQSWVMRCLAENQCFLKSHRFHYLEDFFQSLCKDS